MATNFTKEQIRLLLVIRDGQATTYRLEEDGRAVTLLQAGNHRSRPYDDSAYWRWLYNAIGIPLTMCEYDLALVTDAPGTIVLPADLPLRHPTLWTRRGLADICVSLGLTDHADLYWGDERFAPAYPRPAVTRRLTMELFNYVVPPPLETLFGDGQAPQPQAPSAQTVATQPASAKPEPTEPEPTTSWSALFETSQPAATPEPAQTSSESSAAPRRLRSLKDYMSDPNCLPDIMR